MKTAKQIILSELGMKSIPQLKKKLKEVAVSQYGTLYGEIKKPTFKVYYTGNENHFCSYGVSLNMVGMVNTMALDSKSITSAGKKRGCAGMYLK